MNFENLGIPETILETIEEKDFDEPTEIQEDSIPAIIEGKDVIAESATGSGKTLAFATGIIEKCDNSNHINAVVLAPTRELAKQVSEMVRELSDGNSINVVPIYGGVSIKPQINRLKSADVVVGTPGRMLDHLRRGTMDLSKVKIFVLDEADRMLDMGFIDDVEKIMRKTPKNKQNIFASATVPREVKRLANKYMKDKVVVSAEDYVDASKLKQVYYDIKPYLKLSLLVHILKKEEREESDLSMIFCNTRRTVNFVERNLKKQGIKAQAIHGGFSQNQRDRAMDNFHSENVDVLVCTDVAARGLDIQNVTHIYNYDIPNDSKQYIHRIGRTARAGEKGKAINLLSPPDHDNFRRINRDHDVNVDKVETPYVEQVNVK
ncbi:MAG: DEAD/DEAH box helicase [Candidatus Aenigmatarchaeota archaeon]